MAGFSSKAARDFYAQTYDTMMSDWPGEKDFYNKLAVDCVASGKKILELACGTGRIALSLAEQGFSMVGLDSSPVMLDIAKRKSSKFPDVLWFEGDMRSYDLNQTFPLIIIPAHSFQNLNNPDDQLAALESIHKHLEPGGVLIIHIDHLSHSWLGELGQNGEKFQPAGSFEHPKTKQIIQVQQSWSYHSGTQQAISETIWETVNNKGEILEQMESGPLTFHCFFRYEMEHLLSRSGFAVKELYGDFMMEDLGDDSSEMIWVAGKQ